RLQRHRRQAGALLLPDRRAPARSVQSVSAGAGQDCPIRERAGCAGDAREAELGAGILEAAGGQEHLEALPGRRSRLRRCRFRSYLESATGSLDELEGVRGLAGALGYVSGTRLTELREVRTRCARLVTALARSIS